MTAGKPAQGSPYQGTAHAPENQQLFGLYLGTVTHTRAQDLWVQVNIPQILGDQDSNWARPIGFNSVGSLNPPVAEYVVTTDTGGGNDYAGPVPLPWGGFTGQQYPGQPTGWSATEAGPGPPAGSLVVICFLGGDRNRPGYFLTSQYVG